MTLSEKYTIYQDVDGILKKSDLFHTYDSEQQAIQAIINKTNNSWEDESVQCETFYILKGIMVDPYL